MKGGGARWQRVGVCWVVVVLTGAAALGGLALTGAAAGGQAQAPARAGAGPGGVAPEGAAEPGAAPKVEPVVSPTEPSELEPDKPAPEAEEGGAPAPPSEAAAIREALRGAEGGEEAILLGEFLRVAREAGDPTAGAGVAKAALPTATTSNIGSLLQFFLRVFDQQQPGGCFDLVVDMGLGCFTEVQNALDAYAFATGEMMQGIPMDLRPRYEGADRDEVVAALRELDVHEALALSLQAHYSEVYGQSLSLVEAAENPLNVTRIELMRGKVGVTDVCCGKFLNFLQKSCLCDSGVTGVLLEVGWGFLGEGDRGNVVGFAQEQCERSESAPLFTTAIQGDLGGLNLAAIDNSAKCRCKQSRSSIRRAQESNERQNFGSFAEAMAFYSAGGGGGEGGGGGGSGGGGGGGGGGGSRDKNRGRGKGRGRGRGKSSSGGGGGDRGGGEVEDETESDCSFSEFEIEAMEAAGAEARAVGNG